MKLYEAKAYPMYPFTKPVKGSSVYMIFRVFMHTTSSPLTTPVLLDKMHWQWAKAHYEGRLTWPGGGFVTMQPDTNKIDPRASNDGGRETQFSLKRSTG